MTKICKYCHKEFTPQNPKHEDCHDCWMKYEHVSTDRHCENCGRSINYQPRNYHFCDECNRKLYHGGK